MEMFTFSVLTWYQRPFRFSEERILTIYIEEQKRLHNFRTKFYNIKIKKIVKD